MKLAYVLSFSYLSKLLSTVLLFAVHSMFCVSPKLTSPLKMGRPKRISSLPTVEFSVAMLVSVRVPLPSLSMLTRDGFLPSSFCLGEFRSDK